MDSNDVATILSTLRLESDPELATIFYEFEDLYEQKLWHQLTERLSVFYHDDKSQPIRLSVFNSFVSKFKSQINQLSLVQFLLQSLGDNGDESLDFLKALREFFISEDANKKRNDGVADHKQGIVFLDIEIARIQLRLSQLTEARDALDTISETLDQWDSVPSAIHGSFYSTNAEFYKHKENYNNFYYTSLLYLSTLTDGLKVHEQQKLARDLSVAALLGDKIYNFGELLQHPIMNTLAGSSDQWLLELLNSLTQGQFDQFNTILAGHPNELNESFLRQKICLMTLVESVFVKSVRTLTFTDIAVATKLDKSHVEHLVMRAISLGLLKGSIDQVDELVTITWVQPRIINEEQISKMAQRLTSWNDNVSQLSEFIDAKGSSIWC